ncbi:uncharacterized protein LOC131551521 [Onychostoma macrolepis]|uniref:uncharacterized protein LOC131551521 n=1 Tax=Onychostoma macrolepis TaxID=369639 RepID=UPI00272ABAE4|nr:uncharacterized protein LOC131551521 [Onychostoma macrolepis]
MDTHEELLHNFVFAKSPINTQAQREKESIFCLDGFHADRTNIQQYPFHPSFISPWTQRPDPVPSEEPHSAVRPCLNPTILTVFGCNTKRISITRSNWREDEADQRFYMHFNTEGQEQQGQNRLRARLVVWQTAAAFSLNGLTYRIVFTCILEVLWEGKNLYHPNITTTIPEPATRGLRLFNVRCFSLFTEYAQLASPPGQKGLGERDHHERHIVLTQLPCLRRDNIP